MSRIFCAALLGVALCACLATKSFATEGGGSHYMAGSRGDFAMALLGPAGWYFRNDLSYSTGDINALVVGNTVYAGATQDVWVDNIKIIYLAERGLLDGRFGAVLSVPVVLDAEASADLVSPPIQREGNRTGFADMNMTVFNNWKFGNFSYSGGLTIYAPTGSYDADRLINLGRNYWTFDFMFASTWLNPKRGHELSYTIGYMVNTENTDTSYQSGDEFHLDLHVAQHFSQKFAVGIGGYYYKQITDDDGPLLDNANALLPTIGAKPLGGNRAEAYGLGPAIKYATQLGDRDVNLIAKWLHDFDTTHRFESDMVMFSVAFKF